MMPGSQAKTKGDLISELAAMRDRLTELNILELQHKSDIEILRSIVEGTAEVTSSGFFRSLVRQLATTLKVRYAFVTECTNRERTRVRVLALWLGNEFGETLEYEVEDTPCEAVLAGTLSYLPRDVQALFPRDSGLVKLGAESYIGIPLFDANGSTLGHLAVLDDKELGEAVAEQRRSLLKLFSARAAAELERKAREDRQHALIEWLQQAEENLRSKRAQLEEAQATAHFGSWEWNVRTNVVAWSDEFVRILGVDKDTCVPGLEEFFDKVHPEDRDRVRGFAKAAFEHRQPVDSDYRIVWPDGTIRFLQGRLGVVADADGQPLRLAGTAHDVTDRKLLEQRLLVADRMESLGTLTAGIAHEINNPLTSVVANLELAVNCLRDVTGETASRPVREWSEMIEDARLGAERIAGIVRGLQTFSRVDGERRRLLDVHEVLDRAIEIAVNEVRHRARVVKSYGSTPTVSADESRLTHVFVNLLLNAAHAIPEGHADRNEVRLVTRTDGSGRAIVEVRDTGEGLAEEVRRRLFDPFFTTKPVGAGRGLGLWICHGVVTAIGGEITIESERGRGTTVRITLPPAEVEAPRRHGPPEVDTVLPGRRGRILVVDDEPAVLRTILRLISTEHEVLTATNGREALAHIRSGTFDVILCDLMMPTMTGMDLHTELLKTAPTQAQRMIFMTGGAFGPRAIAFLAEVPNERFEKPLDISQLRARIRSLVG